MRVDKIIPHGKTRSKVLFSEGLVLILYNGELRKYRIEEGGELSDSLYNNVLLPNLTARAKERLVYILKSSDKTESEVRAKLRECCYPEEALSEAVSWAKSKHFVDDSRYAENYINYHSGGRSKKVIKMTLLQKGISKDIIESLLDETEVDEISQIKKELDKRRYSPEMDMKEKQKIFAALARKGYSFGQIKEAADADFDPNLF